MVLRGAHRHRRSGAARSLNAERNPRRLLVCSGQAFDKPHSFGICGHTFCL